MKKTIDRYIHLSIHLFDCRATNLLGYSLFFFTFYIVSLQTYSNIQIFIYTCIFIWPMFLKKFMSQINLNVHWSKKKIHSIDTGWIPLIMLNHAFVIPRWPMTTLARGALLRGLSKITKVKTVSGRRSQGGVWVQMESEPKDLYILGKEYTTYWSSPSKLTDLVKPGLSYKQLCNSFIH